MKLLCPDCNSTVTIDETSYSTGETATGFCPRCGAVIKAVVENGGQELPVKVEQEMQETAQYPEAEVVRNNQPNMDHELKKAELALKAKELEIREKEIAQNNAHQNSAYQNNAYMPPISSKSKTTAGILGILLGGLGAHHFYLGNTGRGIVYLIFCWTYIPSLIGLIEGISYLTKSDHEFAAKYPGK